MKLNGAAKRGSSAIRGITNARRSIRIILFRFDQREIERALAITVSGDLVVNYGNGLLLFYVKAPIHRHFWAAEDSEISYEAYSRQIRLREHRHAPATDRTG